jgi:hypothetical protein
MTAAGLLAAAASVASAGGVRVVTADSGRVWTDARHGYYVAAPVVVVREPLRLRFVESYNGVGPPVSTVPWGPDYEIYRDKISGGMQ